MSFELQESVSQLNVSCSTFKDRVHEIVASHKRNRRTLQCHLQLLELLELPQLVESCARNGLLDEAIELSAFVKSLERRHILTHEVKSSEVADGRDAQPLGRQNVIQTIVKDVNESLRSLRIQLLQLLSDNVSMAKQIHVLAILRKLDTIISDSSMAESAELRRMMDYLEARTQWLSRSQLDSSSAFSNKLPSLDNANDFTKTTTAGPYGQAMQLLESRRTSLYTVVTQFRALFNMQLLEADTLLRAWTTRQINAVVTQLRQLLGQIDDGSAIRALLEQSVFFAKRLATEGVDFTNIVVAVFRDNLLDRMRRDTSAALQQYKHVMQYERLQVGSENQMVPLYVPASTVSVGNDGDNILSDHMRQESFGDLKCPLQILSFPPLCLLLNAFLSTLNMLRACPLGLVYDDCCSLITSALSDIITHLVDHSSDLQSRGAKYLNDPLSSSSANQSSRGKATKKQTSESLRPCHLNMLYAETLCFDFIPHVLFCLEVVFGRCSRDHLHTYEALLQSSRNPTSASASGEHKHAIVDKKTLDRVFGGDFAPIGSVVAQLWQRIVENKLLSSDPLATTPLPSLPPVLPAAVSTVASAAATQPNAASVVASSVATSAEPVITQDIPTTGDISGAEIEISDAT